MTDIKLTVNGVARSDEVEPRLLLIHYLRETLGLRAANVGCDTTSCGACTVLLDGKPVLSCLVPLAAIGDRPVRTIESLGTAERPGPVQAAFIELQAAQCGYCIAGMVMRAQALLERNPSPTEDQIREAMMPNLCRCGTHMRILRAVQRAALAMKGAAL